MKYIPLITTVGMIELAFFAGILSHNGGAISILMMGIAGLLAGSTAARLGKSK